jgi:hypothetical protein
MSDTVWSMMVTSKTLDDMRFSPELNGFRRGRKQPGDLRGEAEVR